MVSKINWKALDEVYTRSEEKPRPTMKNDAVPPHVKVLDDWVAAEERAAIMEFDGGLSRAEAEALAFAGVKGMSRS